MTPRLRLTSYTILPAAALALAFLAGCSAPQSTAAGIMAGYIAEAQAVSVYAATPTADPIVVAGLRACDNAAYAAVVPVSSALMAGTSVASAVIASASAGLAKANACLASLGVKL